MSDTKKPLSETHKLNISNKLKNAHAEGRHSGWLHINSDPLRMSWPEKSFKKLINKSVINDSYTIIYGFPIFKYCLDFAIIDLKIDIEIDGVQHIKSTEAIEHDRIRDEYLMQEGWKVYRISQKELYDSNIDTIKELSKFINTEKTYRKYDVEFILNQYKGYEPKYGTRDEYFTARRNEINEEMKPMILELTGSIIDFSKFGWVGKASKVLGIHPQKVNQWMKRHMLDFYEDCCYKRKA